MASARYSEEREEPWTNWSQATYAQLTHALIAALRHILIIKVNLEPPCTVLCKIGLFELVPKQPRGDAIIAPGIWRSRGHCSDKG